MEQAVNQFNKGLQMDTHPMVQGNDTLSDALNATFVTMNGNEVVLQNDMGNRKIDNASLPAGYTPVGIKEYGGVIYVAAYNPLTSRGQIGSFPSPQRKINIQNSSSSLDFNNFLEVDEDISIGINNITIPISINENGETITLHTGDKFSVYSNDITSLLPYIYPNTSGQYLKNNLFTFQIGLFNSQNEFIDISDKLKLWDLVNGGTHYNYYINNSQVDNSNNGETDLIKVRNSLGINTYSYKMASPLYLRVTLNHVDSISYSIIGDKIDNTHCKIYIDVTYIYNCVDSINGNYFEIEFNGNPCTSIEQNINPIYLPELEKYQLKLSYEIDNVKFEESAFKYTIKFPLLYDDNNFNQFNGTIYQKHLEQSGSLNTTLFGSNAVSLDGYRYYYDQSNNTTTLDVSIQSYPKKNSQYIVYPIIYKTIHNEQTNQDDTEEWELPKLEGNPPGTGSYSIIFNHSQIKSNYGNNLEEREQYKIKFVKKEGENSPVRIGVKDNSNWDGIYVTTPIFNGNYIGKEHSEQVLELSGGYNYELIKNTYIQDFWTIHYFILSPQIECTQSQRKSITTTQALGNVLYNRTENSETGMYNLQDSYEVNTTITPSIKINNQEFYPKEIDTLLTISDISLNNNNPIYRTINNNQVTQSDNKYTYSNGLIDQSRYLDQNPLEVLSISESYSTDTQEIKFRSLITVNNYIKGLLLEKNNISYNHKIISFWDYIKLRYYNSEETKFSGIAPPYVCTDVISTKSSMIIQNGKYEDLSWNDDSPGREFFGERNELPQDQMNALLLTASENLLILDVNTENYTSMCQEPCWGGTGGFPHNSPFKRIWLKVSEKEYTPIYSTYHNPNSEAQIFNDDAINEFTFNFDGFKYKCKHIPHYFAYTQDSGSFRAKIIDYNNAARTNEFDISSEVIINLVASIGRNTSDNFKLIGEENNPNTTVNQQISFSEPNIVSNEKIQDEYEGLRDFKVNCILEHPQKAYNADDGTRIIEYKDSEGNDFDPLYVYYSKPELNSQDIHEIIYDGSFVKSYKASKFKTEKGDDFPELKPSNELYHTSNNRPHPYVNSIVYPSQHERAEIFGNHTNNNIFYYNQGSYPHYAVYKNTLGQYLQYPSSSYSEDDSIKIFENYQGIQRPKHTIQQYNINNSNISKIACIYLDTRNIFDFKFIQDYKLYNWEQDGDPMSNGWIDADTALEIIHN